MSGRRAAPINVPRLALGAMPALALLAALGLLMVAIGDNAARDGDGSTQLLFWLGLATIYAPIAFRLLSAGASREERIALVLTLGLALFLVKVLCSPLEYLRFDELGWWHATDAAIGGDSFAANPTVVSTEGFPGLSTLTAAIAELGGLSIFHAGLIAIGLARGVLMLALFLFLERVTGSARAAGVGIAVYVCNPSFLYFDAQFGYESLALMVAAALLLAALRWGGRPEPWPRADAPATAGGIVLLCCLLVLTHHMTAVAMLAFFVLWLAVAAVLRRRGVAAPYGGVGTLSGPALPALTLGVLIAAWFVLVAGDVTVEELGGVFSRAFHSVTDLFFGGGDSSKQLFDGSGESEHPVARLLVFASVLPLLALIPLGLLRLWRSRARDPLCWALAAIGTLYPVSLGLRLTLAGSETSQRASEFVFVGVAFFAAIVVGAWAWPRMRRRALAAALAATTVALVTFAGGFILGELKATRQPGPYLVGAEDRSVTPEGIAAAEFAAEQLPVGSRLLADRTNATLLAAYGRATPIFGKYNGISVPRVFFSERFDRADRRVVHGQSLAYLVIDRRLSRETPVIGYYIESDEPSAYEWRAPISASALAKFAAVGGVNRIYSNGPIVIYDTTALLR